MFGGPLPDGVTRTVSWSRKGSRVDYASTLRDRDDTNIGQAIRTLHLDGKFGPEMEHTSMKVDRDWQGKGIASALNAQAEKVYREIGVKRITVHAVSDPPSGYVGGYVWARRGYTWANPETAGRIADRIEGLSRIHGDPGRDVLDAIKGLRSGKLETMPTPWDISELRGNYGDGRIGRAALLESVWDGVRWL